MRIQVGGLSDGLYEYSFRAAPADLGLDGQFPGDVQVSVAVDKAGSQVHLTVKVAATGTFPCDRCVTPFERDIHGRYVMHYLQDPEDATRYEPSEVQIVHPGFSVIDPVEDIRQTLLLAVPLKLLCREECEGLCPRCGTNLNTGTCTCTEDAADSRWDDLRRLKRN